MCAIEPIAGYFIDGKQSWNCDCWVWADQNNFTVNDLRNKVALGLMVAYCILLDVDKKDRRFLQTMYITSLLQIFCCLRSGVE